MRARPVWWVPLAMVLASCGGSGSGPGASSSSGSGGTGGADGCPQGEVVCGGACLSTADDPANCGACGHDCLGGACTQGICQPVHLLGGAPAAIAADEVNVYAFDEAAGILRRAPIDGSAPATLAATSATAISTDGTFVYWVDHAPSSASRIAVAGGQPMPLGAGASQPAQWLAVGANDVTWSEVGAVKALPKGGGDPAAVATTTRAVGVAADGSRAYWVECGDAVSAVSSAPLGGGAVTVLSTGPACGDGASSGGVAVDQTNVYWTSATAVLRAPIGGGEAETLSAGQRPVTALLLDGTVLRWATADGALISLPLEGGAPVTIANAGVLPVPQALAASSRSLFWITASGVLKLAK